MTSKRILDLWNKDNVPDISFKGSSTISIRIQVILTLSIFLVSVTMICYAPEGNVEAHVIHSPIMPTHEDGITIDYRPEPGDNTTIVKLTYSIDGEFGDEVVLSMDPVTGNFSHDLGTFPPGTLIKYNVLAWNQTAGESNVTVGSVTRVLWHRDIEEGTALGKKLQRPIMIFFQSDDSHESLEMMEETFNDAKVLDMSANFVMVKVDLDVDPGLVQQFHLEERPTIVFFDKDFKEIYRVSGFRGPDEMKQDMKYVLGKGPKPTKPTAPIGPSVTPFVIYMTFTFLVVIGLIYLSVKWYTKKY